VKGAPADFLAMQELSSQTGIPVGQLLRIVLPFDEETSSADQSRLTSRDEEVLLDAVRSLPALAPHARVLQDLRASLSAVRRLLRVKMADHADFQQVSALICIYAVYYIHSACCISTV
jgi:hypothetical protein